MQDDIFRQAAAWLEAGEPVVMATIVRIVGSSTQPLGSRMVMTRGNRFVGAVSGGCVETDVYEAGLAVIDDGHPLMLHYKKVENPLIEIGLNCDGHIDVLVEPLDRVLLDHLAGPGTRANVTVYSPNEPLAPAPLHAQVLPDGTTSTALPVPIAEAARHALDDDVPVTVRGEGRLALIEPVVSPPRLIIFGGEAVAVPLVRLAKVLGFTTIVTDARPAFATREKHPDADQVLAAWPQEVVARLGADARTYVVSLNHEPRFEDALLHALAGHPVRYLGAIGKPQRRDERQVRAAEAGFDLSQLPPIHTPVGLDTGGKTPAEIALSILAEIIAVKNGRSGGKRSAS